MRNKTHLEKGNSALRSGKYAESIRCYVQALHERPNLGKHLISNLALAKKKYRASRETVVKPDVAVSCWELAHNPAGRAFTLAMLYQSFANVEIIGTIFPRFGCEIWEPIRDSHITIRSLIVADEEQFIKHAIALVLAHPYDIVHLSKPRAPNIFIGILYKEIWGAKVLMDIDDEELGFVNAETPINLEELSSLEELYLKSYDLTGKTWTRIAVGLAKEFDGVTVSNIALKQRYGGEIIHHARDGNGYIFSTEKKQYIREKFGIGRDKKVVLFFGTPREHKGLIETARAISSLKRKDIIFVIVGDFPNQRFKKRLQEISYVEYCFIGNQPFSAVPEITAIGDLCILLQDPGSQVSQFQMPAKLSDALAMGIPILASNTASLADVFAAHAATSVTNSNLAFHIVQVMNCKNISEKMRSNGFSYFKNELDFIKNSNRLRDLVYGYKYIKLSPLLNKILKFVCKINE